ncbi:MAG: thiamine-phosphate kinase [Cellvibrionales bacterium]|nr:thiamine-phosphate kinase [Cellvibrionales bacterium]
MSKGEFGLIQRFFSQQQAQPSSIIQGIGDDCAVLHTQQLSDLVISTDTSIAGKHFPHDADPVLIGKRCLEVAVSDLAAMGATPLYFTLNISLPPNPANWLVAFSKGLFASANRFPMTLIGGDTTKIDSLSQCQMSVTVFGSLQGRTGLYRRGANPNDFIYVSGTLGDGALGLAAYQKPENFTATDRDYLLDAYLSPKAQIQLGQALVGKATSCIDISDGLLSDLGHILNASSVGAEIHTDKVPLSTALKRNMNQDDAIHLALTGGDDYQLCFTSPLSKAALGIDNIYLIGNITQSKGLSFTPNNYVPPKTTGFDHFL